MKSKNHIKSMGPNTTECIVGPFLHYRYRPIGFIGVLQKAMIYTVYPL